MKYAIKIKNLSFSYEKDIIISHTDLSIEENIFYGVIGPNGGGKTTFLKLIMGLLTPVGGEVLVFDKLPFFSRQEIGYVPQAKFIDRYLPVTAFEFILLGALSKSNWLGKFPQKIITNANHLIDLLGLEKQKKTAFSKLSGGQKQKVLIARALVSDPKLLILDEPTASLDQESEQAIFELLLSYRGKKTILMVNHDLNIIIEKVESIISIDKTITICKPNDICEHFALGLYHHPILKKEKK